MRLPLGWVRRRARELADPLLLLRSRGPTPIPPRRLRARTGAPGLDEFVRGGAQAADELARALAVARRSFGDARSVLDLGCGSARVLPHVAALAPTATCTGCDVDTAAITWAARHYPKLSWVASPFEPPLPFADRSFDLVYSISVFSHLGEELQDRWLAELRRLLRPGGVALLSVHGSHAFEQFRTGQATTAWCRADAFARGPLQPAEFVYEPYVRSLWNEGELPGVGRDYGLAFHGEQYVRRHFSQWLGIEAVLPRAMTSWQDIVICAAP